MVEILCLVVYVDLQYFLVINPTRLKYQLKNVFWSAPWNSRYLPKLHLQELFHVTRNILDARSICTIINSYFAYSHHNIFFLETFTLLRTWKTITKRNPCKRSDYFPAHLELNNVYKLSGYHNNYGLWFHNADRTMWFESHHALLWLSTPPNFPL